VVHLAPKLVTHHVFTDACKAPAPCIGIFTAGGFASLDFEQLEQQQLLPLDPLLDINHWECYAVLIALRLFAAAWSRSRVVVFCDNMATVEWLSSGSARPPSARLLVQEVFSMCVTHHIRLHVQHIPGEKNVLADALSRKQWARFVQFAQPVLRTQSKFLATVLAAM
jgi:hypothetical protein